MDSCVERILQGISSMQIDQKTFAQMIGVNPQAITDWKNGKTISYKRHIEKIAEALGTSVEYLLTGEGPKQRGAVSESDTQPDDIVELVSAYQQAAPELQAAVRRVLGLE